MSGAAGLRAKIGSHRGVWSCLGPGSSRESFTAPGKPSVPLLAVAQGLIKAHCLGRAHVTSQTESEAQRIILNPFWEDDSIRDF